MKEQQIINEAPPEEEENESQDIMGSRMQQSSGKSKVTYPSQPLNEANDSDEGD